VCHRACRSRSCSNRAFRDREGHQVRSATTRSVRSPRPSGPGDPADHWPDEFPSTSASRAGRVEPWDSRIKSALKTPIKIAFQLHGIPITFQLQIPLKIALQLHGIPIAFQLQITLKIPLALRGLPLAHPPKMPRKIPLKLPRKLPLKIPLALHGLPRAHPPNLPRKLPLMTQASRSDGRSALTAHV